MRVPIGGGRPAWPRHDPSAGNAMILTNGGATTGADPLKERLDPWQSVWEQYR